MISDKFFPKEGEIWLVKFEKLKEFSKPYRPCLIVSNNAQNRFDTKIVVVATTTEDLENVQLFEVLIKNSPETGLDEPSKILCNYPHTIHKELRLIKYLGTASKEIILRVKSALKITLNFDDRIRDN